MKEYRLSYISAKDYGTVRFGNFSLLSIATRTAKYISEGYHKVWIDVYEVKKVKRIKIK